MSRFSQHLIKKRLLTQEQLEEALQHQAVYGGRVGTNLVELRMIRVDKLAEALSEFHQVPLPPRQWLERPKKSAVERVTRPLVERIRFIPLRLENNVLHAAVLDPNDPRTLDDLRFATGCRIQPYVLPEIWMHDWLLALFKLPRGIRHVETGADEPPRELNEPAQDFDFQAAQAALAAKAARIMVPATVGIVESKPPSEDNVMRKTMQGADARASIPGEPRTSTMQGALRQTMQGARPLAERTTLQGAQRQTLSGEQKSGLGISSPFEGRASTPAEAPRVNLSELGGPVLERPVAAAGASVRPPPVSMRSLTEMGGRTSMVHAPVFAPPPGNVQPLEVAVPWDENTGRLAAPLPPAGLPSPPAGLPLPPAGLPSPPLAAPQRPVAFEPSSPPPPSAAPVALPPPPAPPVAPAAVKPRELTELEYALRDATDRDQLLDSSFEMASRFARVVALFIVHRGMVQGVRCIEDGVTRSVQGVLVPLESASMLTQAASQVVPFRIDPRERPLDARVHRLLTELTSSEVGLFPVVVKTRVVNLLYACHGREPLGTVAFGALSLLATEMGAAYGQLILNRKGSAGS